MSLAGSSTDHLLTQCITGGRPAECNKSTSLRLLISRHGTPHHLPDEGNEKEDNDDDNYEKSDNYDDADNEQNNSHKNKSNKDNDAQRIKRLAYLGKHPCIECGRHFPQSVWNITTCEPCDKYWGLKNGADKDGKKSHGYRPPGHQFFHSSQSPSAKAKARANNQHMPPLVSSYEPQHWGVPPPPRPPLPPLPHSCSINSMWCTRSRGRCMASMMWTHRMCGQSGCIGRSRASWSTGRSSSDCLHQ